MITVVAYSALVHISSVYGPFDSRFAAADWLHKEARREKDSLNEHYNEKWTIPGDQQGDEFAEIHEDGDLTITYWVVEMETPK